MENDQILGVFLFLAGMLGAAHFKLEWGNVTPLGVISIFLFAIGLYLVLRK